MKMGDKMKKRALPITNITLSSNVIKTVSIADRLGLKICNEVVTSSNERERVNNMECFNGYKSIHSPYFKSLKK